VKQYYIGPGISLILVTLEDDKASGIAVDPRLASVCEARVDPVPLLALAGLVRLWH